MFGYMNPSSDTTPAPATSYNPVISARHSAVVSSMSPPTGQHIPTSSSIYYSNNNHSNISTTSDSPYCYYQHPQHPQHPQQQQQQQHQYYNYPYSTTTAANEEGLTFHHHHQLPLPQPTSEPPITRPKLTTSIWEDQNTICFQVDARGICVARRQDNDMVNGTKLLNVTGISRGKRDGILKNERGRVVVKVGAMHLKGVWITFARAKALAGQFNIDKVLHPLFEDDPTAYFCQYFANNMQATSNNLGSFYLTSQKHHQRENSDNTASSASYMSSHPQQYSSTSASEEQHAATAMYNNNNNNNQHPYVVTGNVVTNNSSSGFSSSSSSHHHQQQHHLHHQSSFNNINNNTNNNNNSSSSIYQQQQRQPSTQQRQEDWVMSPPFSDHTELQQLVLGGSSIISESAPGTPDVNNMFPPHDASAGSTVNGGAGGNGGASFSYSFASPTSSLSPLPMMPNAVDCQQQEDDFYYFYHQH
ncbi:hypothetical protein INT45_005843 [Circinella minor]|uniref:HTH APSES-type domain-containing protein n=1 Tax=Circinella minor TaxID=1195481 RepID=A0A8H7RZE8_9FUNG|nr:hypothetical protein INT45_005843 [Circinella minor]